MGEIFLDTALVLLSSEKQKDRVDGLADLKHVLQQNKRNSKLLDLNDKACHNIFESLFRFVAVEKPVFNRAQRSNSKNPAATRLSTCASVLRIAVDIFVRNLRTKTVRAIVDHVTETIPVPGEGLWEPLNVDYTKCLTSLLHYPPHIEHLGDAEWEKLVEFCLTTIAPQESESSQLSSRSVSRFAAEDPMDLSDGRSTPSQRIPPQGTREKFVRNVNAIGEAVVGIQLLVSSPSAPLQPAAESLLQGLTDFVKSPSMRAGIAHQAALSSINTIVSKVLLDQSELVRSCLLNLIPVIRRLWSSKIQTLRDELLRTMMLSMVILVDAAQREPSQSLAQLMEDLTDSLYSEYTKRPEKELLQVDEIIFNQETANGNKPVYGPRLGNPRSEHNWTILWTIANLLKLSQTVASPSGQDFARGTSKRQRLNSAMDDVFRDAVSATGTKRICALQLVPLLAGKIDLERKQSFLRQLVPNTIDDSGTIASWSLVAIASIASGPDAKASSIKAQWPRVADLASRAFSSSVTSRAACKLLCVILEADLLEYHIFTDTIHSILSSANMSGPSAISDASLYLWALVARMRAQASLGSAHNASKQICSWLRDVWTIGTVTDRIQAAQIALFARPLDLLNLLFSCTNRPFEQPSPQYQGPPSLIGRTWWYLHENQEVLDYLFKTGSLIADADPWNQETTWKLNSSTHQGADDAVILELLRTKSEMFLQTWKAMSEDRSLHVTPDTLQILVSFCIVSALFQGGLSPAEGRMQDTQQNRHLLWSGICDYLATHGSDALNPCLEIISSVLPSVSRPNDCSILWPGLHPLIDPLLETLERMREKLKEISILPKDIMEMDDQMAIQGDISSTERSILLLNRESLPFFPDEVTFQRCVTVRLFILSLIFRTRSNDDTPQSFSSVIAEYLVGLDEADLLAARQFLPEVYRNSWILNREDMLRVLEDLGEKCLQSYEMERCEASHNLCISMMTGFVASWTDSQDDTLNHSAMDLYSWFMEVLLAKKRASLKTYIALAELIQVMLEASPSYGNEQSLASPRTSLLSILQEGDIQAKFSVATFIPLLFERFSLQDHDAIFDDVLESLPRDPDWIEGIALRLFALCRIASKWPTLLRRGIYHIFETPAQVPASLEYAQKCTGLVSKALGLQDVRELFRIFAPQVIYTWTETQTVTSMPYSIFEYGSLKEMLNDVKDEVVAQIMMRGKESETQELADYLEKSRLELLRVSFHKAEAYCISRDISTPPGQGSQPKGVEVQLRKLLGPEGFMTEIENCFPQVTAVLFLSLDHCDQIERALTKRSGFRYALDIQKKIEGKSVSQIPLPASQQPSFRARYLLDELEFLCKRAGFELESIWTATLVSFICRSLLESIQPALGSLHTCSVIRKIKVLVCLSGSTMLQDYPFEMLLFALRPHLVDMYCSQDALGIMWYLLEAGKSYLSQNPGFLAGISISILISLRQLFRSSSENTLQLNQSKAAISDAQRFCHWLEAFVDDLYSEGSSEKPQQPFSRLLKLARGLSVLSETLPIQGEKDLVFEVLKDQDSATPLLSKSVADLVLSLLCPEFQRNLDNDVDAVSSNVDPASHIVSLWQTLHKFDAGPEYRQWAARVIGRSFAATGKIHESLLREQELSFFDKPVPSEPLNPLCDSKARILQILCEKLQSQDNREAGLTERTLQLILSNIAAFPEFQECAAVIPEKLVKALIWNPYTCPALLLSDSELERCQQNAVDASGASASEWARNIALSLSSAALQDPVLSSLRKILNVIPDLAFQLLPYIIHDVLLAEGDRKGQIRQQISHNFGQILSDSSSNYTPHSRLAISCILYLRNVPLPDESTIVERDNWLDINYGEASAAAHRCGWQKTSLLFLEIEASRVVSASRRSSVARYEPPVELLHDVFKNIDDPDLFYGIQQSSSLATVMERLEYEGSGFKNLFFQSAQYDSEIQMSDEAKPSGVLKALNSTNLQGIAHTILSTSNNAKDGPTSVDSMLQAATSLQKWDIPVSPLDSSSSATVFRVFQSLNTCSSSSEIVACIDNSLLATLKILTETGHSAIQLRTSMRALGIMTEISDVLKGASPEQISEEFDIIMARSNWLKTESYHEVGEILSWHEGLFSSIRKHEFLKSGPSLTLEQARLFEAQVFRQSLQITRNHGVSQASLKSAISLSKLAEPCGELGLNIEGATKFDLANVLWDQGEMTASIRMLQHLKAQGDLHKQAIPLSRAELLVTLGHHVAEARLEKPESILQDYLHPAVKELKGTSNGEEAGRVYHGFATFCDQQLLNPDSLEDFRRVEQLRDRKEKELNALEDLMKSSEGRERESLRNFRAKTKQWFDLDDREYQRLLRSREAFLQQCLENYLLALRESDAYNNDVLRFCALWLDKSDSKTANTAVSRYLSNIPSRKFAPLMNQLSSRLLDISNDFQSLLTELVYRICAEHPFHGMYQIFASSKSKGGKDPSSHSRFRAANQLVERLKNDKAIGPTWIAVHNMNISYVRFAIDKPDNKFKTGARIPLKKLSTGDRLEKDVDTYKLPPPTMRIELRADCDYSNVPIIARFSSEFTLASGVSAPKVVTAVATNGVRYKQLYKGGNDDLRQDAIMEQVFEQVSSLLKDHQPTRQRNLGIRTYKVLPLTLNAGIIEFVPNTIPLHDYLMPAHQRYFPKDMKPNVCRKHIADVQTRSFEQRVRTYREVAERFHPVMRYFFMEKFNNPDDWFSKRLSYTRSTAAISILGHVLGLGDRHGHNILLDETTGEVVHIDLGVAFEQGRILPVPEVVPFRLTRDLVDGFGITKTEGVFRRCCEFTLESLRQESYSIMTILDVLRYDPLYSWTVSPLRMKKMQDNQEAGDGPPVLPGATDRSSKNEPSEADRALTVVAKKLSKTLSVTATVNELIQQATDEKNLAVLYCGWAAYA